MTKRYRNDGKEIYVNEDQICYTIDVPNGEAEATYETVAFSNGTLMILKKESGV